MAASRHDNHGSRPPGGFLRRVADLYAGGFREMTVGRTLWAVILIKLAIMFLVFKLFFFPTGSPATMTPTTSAPGPSGPP